MEEALEINQMTNTDLWRKAINKEMSKVKSAWKTHDANTPKEVRDGKVPELTGFQEIGCHIVFDIKMDFTQKARFIAGSHTTEAPSSLTYSSAVSHDSVQIAFLIATLNDLDLMSCDLENAYLVAPCREKICFKGGLECREDKDKVCIVVHSLYGLKSAGVAFWAALAQVLQDLGYTSSKANPDVWMHAAVKPNGHKYYKMLFVNINDILALSHKATESIQDITKFYKAMEGSIKPPGIYLGADVAKIQLPDGCKVWSTSPCTYVKNSILVVKHLLKEDGEGYVLKSKVCNPFPTGYKPKIDVTNELDQTMASHFMQLIGILCWAVEIGCINIYLETSLLSQYQANPRFGHLEAAYHIFAYFTYLKHHPDMG